MRELDENKATFKEWVKEYSSALKIKEVYDNDGRNGLYSFLFDFKTWFYNTIHKFLEPNKKDEGYEQALRYYSGYIAEKILPVCQKKITELYTLSSNDISNDTYNISLYKWIELEDDFYALASYRNLKLFAIYLERDFPEKIWQKTMHLFENFFDYAQRLVFGEKIRLIRASYFPGAGKSYAANILSAFWFGYDSNISILRITFSSDLCKEFIRKTAMLIDTPRYRKVFPKFDIGEMTAKGNNELYSKYSVDMGFQFKFSYAMNLYSSTRDGQITGKRGKVIMIDDLIKGIDEATDEVLNNKMKNKYDSEWCSRADTSYQPVIALGTMWSNMDLLNLLEWRTLKNPKVEMYNDEKYKYTRIAKTLEGKLNSVFIATPMLDYETDESTCLERYDTESLREKRDDMEEYIWNSVYQQRPTPPEDVIFSEKKLQVYTDETYPLEKMKTLQTQVCSFFDPTRTGKDYMAFLIFKRYKENNEWSKWYFIDCICDQSPHKEKTNEICAKIINHKIYKFGYENNVDISLGDLLKLKLTKEMGYKEPIIFDSVFSSDNKQGRIFRASPGIKKEIVFPAPSMYKANSDMGRAMRQLTTWSVQQKYGDHDDVPDCLAMFVKNYCEDENITSTMQVLSKEKFSLWG